MKIRFVDYLRDFKCIADKCTDTCCAAWNVVVDELSAEEYKKIGGSFGEKIRSVMTVDEDGDIVFVNRNDKCPFLLDSGLCEMYIKLGAESLCETCTRYPRIVHEFGNLREISLSLSCPEAARLLCECKDGICLEEEETDEFFIGDVEFEPLVFKRLLQIRENVLSAAQNRNITIDERYAEIESLCGGFGKMSSDMFAKALPQMHILNDNNRKLFEEWGKYKLNTSAEGLSKNRMDFLKYFSDREFIFENLFVYYIFRYFLLDCYDEYKNLFKTMIFFGYNVVCEILTHIYVRKGRVSDRGIRESILIFSKEIEHCEKNVKILLGFIK